MDNYQKFNFSIMDSVLVELAETTLDRLHFDVDTILVAYEKVEELAKCLGVEPPKPGIAGFTYPHLVALGADVEFPPDSEPTVHPIISSPEEIDSLSEPEDYLANKYIQERLEISSEIKRRRPDARHFIGHLLEGPITTAVLIMGQDFFMLPYDNPERTHKLLDFSVTTAINYAKAISDCLGDQISEGEKWVPDDFMGMLPPNQFDEYVVPYTNRIFEGLKATHRSLHSELFRIDHLDFLKSMKINFFDSGTDPYLNPDSLKEHCPCSYQCRITPWTIRDHTEDELERIYREIDATGPEVISFELSRLEDEPKIKRLLKVAKELATE